MKKRVMLLIQRMPYPLIGGDRIKNHYLIKILKKHFDLDLVVIAEGERNKEIEEKLAENTCSFKIFNSPKWRYHLNTLRTIFNFKPLQVNYFYFKKAQKYINQRANQVDFIIASFVRTTEYVRNFNVPKIFDMADSIAFRYKFSHKKTTSLFWKLIYFIEYPLLLRYEKKMVEIFDKTLLFNKREIEFLNSPKAVWVPHGVNPELFEYEQYDPQYSNFITFFGKMDYRSNIEAVLWFVENVFFYLNENIMFQIIGGRPTKEILALEKMSPRIIVRGWVEDPYVMLRSSLCNVAPMQIGGGIQNKILEAMAIGSLVVTNSYSSFPIAKPEDNVLLIADKPEEWIKTINEIYENPEKYKPIRKNARTYIKRNFTWDLYEKYLLNYIEEVLSSQEKTSEVLELKSI